MIRYDDVKEAVFIKRSNRFVATVLLCGKETAVHVKNTGRLGELLVPGAKVYLAKSENPARKTAYDLVAVYRNGALFNVDSQVPNRVVQEALPRYFSNITYVKPEYVYADARIDFYMEADGKRILLEVKGVTLDAGGTARFPDAPTLRGTKHLRHLAQSVRDGFTPYVFFCLQWQGATAFSPNEATDPLFAQALKDAVNAGVTPLAADCVVTENGIELHDDVPIFL